MSAACATTSFDFDRFAFELILRKRPLETRIGKVVIGLIPQSTLSDDEGDWLFSGVCRDHHDF